MPRRMPIDDFKRSFISSRMPISVVPKLTQGNPLGPFGGMIADKTSQVAFDLLIHTLSLAISLRVSCRTHP